MSASEAKNSGFNRFFMDDDNSLEAAEDSTDKLSQEDCDQVPCKFLQNSMQKFSNQPTANKLNKTDAMMKQLFDAGTQGMPVIGSPLSRKNIINNIINFDIIYRSKKYSVVSD